MKNWQKILERENLEFKIENEILVVTHGNTIRLSIESKTVSGIACAYLQAPNLDLDAVKPEYAIAVFKDLAKVSFNKGKFDERICFSF